MGLELDYRKKMGMKIEIVRELLYKKIEDNIDREEIQQISEILDKLIIDYLVK